MPLSEIINASNKRSDLRHEKPKEYNMFTRDRIIEKWESGVSDIAKQLNIPYSSVYGIVQKWKANETVESTPRCGGPKKLKSIDLRYLERYISREPFTTYDQILQDLKLAGIEISRSTLKATLKGMGYQSYIPSKKPCLTDNHKKRRLQWAKDKVNWSLEDWKRVVWSDESLYQVKVGVQTGRVIRKVGQRYDEDKSKKTSRHEKEFCRGMGLLLGRWSGAFGLVGYQSQPRRVYPMFE